MVKCSFPGCSHRGEVITKVHCRTAHNIEREELFKKYGKPVYEVPEPKAMRANMKLYSAYRPSPN
jgi:hypothetical protein